MLVNLLRVILFYFLVIARQEVKMTMTFIVVIELFGLTLIYKVL